MALSDFYLGKSFIYYIGVNIVLFDESEVASVISAKVVNFTAPSR